MATVMPVRDIIRPRLDLETLPKSPTHSDSPTSVRGTFARTPSANFLSVRYEAKQRMWVCDGMHEATLAELVDVVQFAMFGHNGGRSVREVLQVACAQLDVEPKGGFLQQARACYEAIYVSPNAALCNNPHYSGAATSELAGCEDCGGPSPTERSDRSASAREAPPSLRLCSPKTTSARLPRISPRILRLPSPTAAVEPEDLVTVHV
mmetsp:Transcript_33229/g.87383  ORF Transcript_33229/g.87383 Transcript_33229/m.87383 type:complete len:207 (+) Transcript_33229:375-995(+)|eukprot:CAMPEP_0115827360 /NCGR_PEP_ID=MMETSP0287-20121206/2_1 /TAXON_ID=412157 /ORGANISM="Chrysochromulina rotalis, Strain UIO044" /LENGTH=206 /DNA_ID=CAMNT_0003280511 /DNA_START=255 /DNA_END=875 /DNA_ORIENTATION=+